MGFIKKSPEASEQRKKLACIVLLQAQEQFQPSEMNVLARTLPK
jgi:uncharacterized protein YfkK (UPF0435 family)